MVEGGDEQDKLENAENKGENIDSKTNLICEVSDSKEISTLEEENDVSIPIISSLTTKVSFEDAVVNDSFKCSNPENNSFENNSCNNENDNDSDFMKQIDKRNSSSLSEGCDKECDNERIEYMVEEISAKLSTSSMNGDELNASESGIEVENEKDVLISLVSKENQEEIESLQEQITEKENDCAKVTMENDNLRTPSKIRFSSNNELKVDDKVDYYINTNQVSVAEISMLSTPQSVKVDRCNESPSMMSFPEILKMWEQRDAVSCKSLESSIHITKDVVSNIAFSDKFTTIKAPETLLDKKVAKGDDDSNKIDLLIVQDADMIVATEFADDKPCVIEPELDCDTDEETDSHSEEPQNHKIVQDGKIRQDEPESATTPTDNLKTPTKRFSFREIISSGKKIASSKFQPSLPSLLSPSPNFQSSVSSRSFESTYPSTLPDPENIIAFGEILVRSSFLSKLTKKWSITECFWLQYKTEILIFQNFDDYDNWVRNPDLSQKERKLLVKLHVDFLKDQLKQGIRGYRMMEIKPKKYSGVLLYNFKLEKWTDLGSTVEAAFASQDKQKVEALRTSIANCLRQCPKNGLFSINDLIKP